jgi:hypothetical protein
MIDTANSTDGNFYCSGGTWFVCSEPELPRFVGCCVSDPCANASGQGCPTKDVRSASFNPNYYSSIGVNACSDFAGSKWYTCANITSTFLGCCKVNPCDQHYCPPGSLTGALWSDKQQEQVFLDGAAADPSAEVSSSIPISSTSSSSATSPAQATTSASVTTSAGDPISSASSSSARSPIQATTPASVTTSTGDSSSTTIQSSNNGSGISTSTIVGIGIGAFVIIVILIAVLMFKCGWDARRKRGGRGTMARESSLMTADYVKSSLSPDRGMFILKFIYYRK